MQWQTPELTPLPSNRVKTKEARKNASSHPSQRKVKKRRITKTWKTFFFFRKRVYGTGFLGGLSFFLRKEKWNTKIFSYEVNRLLASIIDGASHWWMEIVSYFLTILSFSFASICFFINVSKNVWVIALLLSFLVYLDHLYTIYFKGYLYCFNLFMAFKLFI